MDNDLTYKKRYEPMDNKISPQMQDILNQLPRESKEVAESFYFTYDLNFSKTAKHLHITEGSVRRRLKTANKKLRKLFNIKNCT